MSRFLLALMSLTIGFALIVPEAEAKRLGGGRSIGAQRNMTAPPAATPAKPQQSQANAAPAAGAAAAPAASGFSRWMPILGGLAIGGLLGSLFAGNGLGGILLLAALAIGGVMLFKMLARRREESAPRPVQFAGMGNERISMPEPLQSGGAASPVAPAVVPAVASVPAGFDSASFLRGAKLNFLKLQQASDQGKLDELRELTTSEMFEELSKDAAGGQQTDVVALNADLLEVSTEGDRHWASVRFSGSVREAPGGAAAEFQEVWNLVKPADGSSGWLLAGIQQMQ